MATGVSSPAGDPVVSRRRDAILPNTTRLQHDRATMRPTSHSSPGPSQGLARMAGHEDHSRGTPSDCLGPPHPRWRYGESGAPPEVALPALVRLLLTAGRGGQPCPFYARQPDTHLARAHAVGPGQSAATPLVLCTVYRSICPCSRRPRRLDDDPGGALGPRGIQSLPDAQQLDC